MIQEKRRFLRHNVCIPVHYTSAEMDFFTVTLDLHEAGAFLYSQIFDTPKTTVDLEFFYIGGNLFKTKAKVVWTTLEINNYTAVGRTGMGIAFIEPALEVVNNIKWYISTYKERPKVVFIDDDPLFLKKVSTYLEKEKVRVITLFDSMFSIKVLTEIDPVAIFIDYNMKELPFQNAITQIKQNGFLKDIPIIVTSSEPEPFLSYLKSEYKLYDYIVKEKVYTEVIDIIKKVTYIRSTRPTLRDIKIEGFNED